MMMMSTVRCQIKVYIVILAQKIMLVYKTYNTINMLGSITTLIKIRFGYVIIISIIANVQSMYPMLQPRNKNDQIYLIKCLGN